MDKLNIANEMAQMDRKQRRFYDELTDEERKKFSNFLMIRWGSAVQGSQDLQEFYVISTNQRLNRHFFSVNRHPKLQWLMATSVSPGFGSQKHTWIAPKKKNNKASSNRKVLMELYPSMKLSDIDVLDQITAATELKSHLRDHGSE